MTLREAIQGLVDARIEIDRWDAEFTPAPYHLYSDAQAALDDVPGAERGAVVELFADPDAAVRREAANACAWWRIVTAHEALVAGLADTDHDARDAFGSALVAVAQETALASIANAGATVSKDILVAAIDAAMQAFGAQILPLVERVGYAPDTVLRERDVWWKLYDLDREAASHVLDRGVATERFDWVYGTSQLVRAKGGGPWVRTAFMKLVGHRESSIATIANEVLHQFGDASAIEPMLAAAVEPGTHPWQRGAAIRSALELGRTSHTPVLARIRQLAQPDEADQKTVMIGLAALAGSTWEPRELLEDSVRIGLHHASEAVVALAIRAARALELETLAADVVATLGHRRYYDREMIAARDDYSRWAATVSLAALVAAIERGLGADADDTAMEVAANATHQLARAPEGRAHVALVRRALASARLEIRCAAASTLAEFGAREACDELLARALHGPPKEASEMIVALTKLGDPRAVDVSLVRIANILGGEQIPDRPEVAWVCASAVRAFGVFVADPRAFEALARSLQHSEMRMRRDAAEAFGRAGDQRALALLPPLLKDHEKQVRTAAQTAIAALGGS